MAMKIRNLFSDKSDRWEVKIIGEIDIHSAQELEEKLNEILEKQFKSIIINMEEVNYLDSTGLGIFIKFVKRLRSQNQDMIFISPQPNILKLFKITGLKQIFNIREE